MTVGESVAASAASPSVFKPMAKTSVDGQAMELVDGGVACANPTLYAFNMAKNLYGYNNVRILSLGSTHGNFEVMFKQEAFETADKYKNAGAMTNTMMAYTTDYFMSYNNFWKVGTTLVTEKAGVLSDNYLRVDGEGTKMKGEITSVENIKVM